MSKIQISPNPSGAGIVTLAAPNTASDVTLTLPAVTAELITNSSGVLNIGSGQLVKDASGNLGVGTASPASDARLTLSSANTESYVMFARTNSGVFDAAIGNNGGSIVFKGGADSSTVAGLNEFARIDSSGNVGIGTSSPTDKLHVASGASTYIRTQNTGASIDAYYGVSGVGAWTGTGTNHPYLFHTNNTERARIDSSGNLLVGTTNTAPGYGNTAVGVRISNSMSNFSASTVDWVMTVNQNTNDGSNRYLIGFRNANVNVGNITGNGTSVAYNTSSDYRLKENVAPMTGALAKVAALKPCTYTWKADGSAGQGFIAHELQAVVPDCVTGEKDAVDKDGKPQYQGVDTSFLVATLVSAIQELTARLEVLENK